MGQALHQATRALPKCWPLRKSWSPNTAQVRLKGVWHTGGKGMLWTEELWLVWVLQVPLGGWEAHWGWSGMWQGCVDLWAAEPPRKLS